MAARPTTAAGGGGGGDEEVSEAGASPELRHRHAGKGAGEAGGSEGLAGGNGAAAGDAASVERVFADKGVPSWREQLTVRAFVVGSLLAVVFNVILMKIDLTTGINPSLNVCASLVSYFLVRVWTKAIESCGLLKQPFTRQENTVIQTCVVSAYGIAFSGKRPKPPPQCFRH